jgi:hypothetical protein
VNLSHDAQLVISMGLFMLAALALGGFIAMLGVTKVIDRLLAYHDESTDDDAPDEISDEAMTQHLPVASPQGGQEEGWTPPQDRPYGFTNKGFFPNTRFVQHRTTGQIHRVDCHYVTVAESFKSLIPTTPAALAEWVDPDRGDKVCAKCNPLRERVIA